MKNRQACFFPKNKNFYLAVAILIGTIVGAGMFGLPYAVAKIGFVPGIFYLFILGAIVLLIHLCYGEVVLRTKENHFLPGYVKIYLGKKIEKIALLVDIVGLSGAFLVYLIIIGQFFKIIFGNLLEINAFQWSVIFFIFASIAIFREFKIVPQLELWITLGFILVILVILFPATSLVKIENLKGFNFEYLFFPFGVFLFALGGSLAIPLMEEILREDKKRLKKAITLGTLIPIVIYFLFILILVGATGRDVSENAIYGLKDLLGERILFLGALLGILTVASSYLTVGLNLVKIYQWDLRLKKTLSWILACFLPFGLFLLGFRSFIEVIGITGTFSGGLAGILMILCFIRAKKLSQERPAYQINLPKIIIWLILLVFVLAIIWQLIEFS